MKKYIKETIEFYDKSIEDYIKKTVKLQDVEWLEKFSSYLHEKARVLDLGCGFGRDCKFFVSKGFDTYGIDLSSKMIEKARTFVKNAKFKTMNLLKLSFKDEYFDGVWCCAILVHLNKKDVNIALKEIKRVLKKKGTVFIGIHKGKGQRISKDKRYGGAKRFHSYFSETEIKELLDKHAFSLMDFKAFYKKNRYNVLAPVIHIIAREK